MTTSIRDEIERARKLRKSPATSLGSRLLVLASSKGVSSPNAIWPSAKYAADPIAFSEDVLGVQLWSKQKEILEAVRDNARVAVKGGRKCGKDFALACLALWWYCSFADARVIMTATTAYQVNSVLWRDVKKVLHDAGRCFRCKQKPRAEWGSLPCPHSAMIDGQRGELARTGLRSFDFREIVGITAIEAEALAGTSGARLLYLIDEASAFPDELHIAIRGNLTSEESREVMISNPTKTEGKFYDAFHSSKSIYKTIHIDTKQGPNFLAGKTVMPGLATQSWLDVWYEEFGKDSAYTKIHVDGDFALNEDGRIFNVHALTLSKSRWFDTPADGPLRIGVDVAGEGGKGDESGFAIRRGLKVIKIYTRRGLTDGDHLVEILGICREYGTPDETPVVNCDVEGEVGNKVEIAIRNFLRDIPGTAPHPFFFNAIRSSKPAQRKPMVFDRLCDELWGNLAAWMRSGGAIPEDAKLEKELHAQEWHGLLNGRQAITPKKDIRALIHRSPDRADAVTLACWDPIDFEERSKAVHHVESPPERPDAYESVDRPGDPWEALKAFGR